MADLERNGSLGGRALVCGLLAALAGLGMCGPARADEGDQPALPPSLFEITRTPVPSADKAMNDAVREGALAPPPAGGKECVHHSGGAKNKKRLSISTALKNLCAAGQPDREAAPSADNGSSP
jgi:hypothetical protein